MSWGQISGIVHDSNSAVGPEDKRYYLTVLESRIKLWQREQLKKKEFEDKMRKWDNKG
jgi:hypothetical protein